MARRSNDGMLLLLQGPSRSGKDYLGSALGERLAARRWFTFRRGIGSQTPEENLKLEPGAQRVLGQRTLRFADLLRPETRNETFATHLAIARIQFGKAIELKSEGWVVVLNRSILDIEVFIDMVGNRTLEEDLDKMKLWANGLHQKIDPMKDFLKYEADGVILMEEGGMGRREREGTDAGISNEEQRLVRTRVQEFVAEARKEDFFLRLNANQHNVDDEVRRTHGLILNVHRARRGLDLW